MLDLAVGRELGLEARDLLTEGERAGAGDTLEREPQVVREWSVLALEIDERDDSGAGPRAARPTIPHRGLGLPEQDGETAPDGRLPVEHQGGGFAARADPELAEGQREVALGRALGEEEALCDLRVREAERSEDEHFLLAVREAGRDQLGSPRGRKHGVPREHGGDRRAERGVDQLLVDDAVDEVPDRMPCMGSARESDDDHAQVRLLPLDPPHGAQHLATDIAGVDQHSERVPGDRLEAALHERDRRLAVEHAGVREDRCDPQAHGRAVRRDAYRSLGLPRCDSGRAGFCSGRGAHVQATRRCVHNFQESGLVRHSGTHRGQCSRARLRRPPRSRCAGASGRPLPSRRAVRGAPP